MLLFIWNGVFDQEFSVIPDWYQVPTKFRAFLAEVGLDAIPKFAYAAVTDAELQTDIVAAAGDLPSCAKGIKGHKRLRKGIIV